MDTNMLIRSAERAIDGEHAKYGWPIKNGPEVAVSYLLLALVREQQAIGAQLTNLDATLARIATALEQRNEQSDLTPAIQPKRRWWQSKRGE